jgi:hypothetical protein
VRRHHRLAMAVLAVAAVIAGCGGTDAPPLVGAGSGDEPGGDTEPQTGATTGGSVHCGGSAYDPAALADAPPASSLPEGPAGAVDDLGDPAFDPADDWRVMLVGDDRAELLRELDEPLDLGEGDVRTHQLIVVERITGATNVPDGTWLLTASGACTQRVELGGGLGEADLTFASMPSPDARTLEVLVHERACASGQTAEGRVEVVRLDETADEVRLVIGVHGLDGAQTCPGNPPTPFTVVLSEPLGDREVVDVSVVPARPLAVADPGSAVG